MYNSFPTFTCFSSSLFPPFHVHNCDCMRLRSTSTYLSLLSKNAKCPVCLGILQLLLGLVLDGPRRQTLLNSIPTMPASLECTRWGSAWRTFPYLRRRLAGLLACKHAALSSLQRDLSTEHTRESMIPLSPPFLDECKSQSDRFGRIQKTYGSC